MDKVAAATVREWHCDKQLSVSDVCNFTLQIDISCVDILGPPKARKKNAMHWYYCQVVISTTSKNKTSKKIMKRFLTPLSKRNQRETTQYSFGKRLV